MAAVPAPAHGAGGGIGGPAHGHGASVGDRLREDAEQIDNVQNCAGIVEHRSGALPKETPCERIKLWFEIKERIV